MKFIKSKLKYLIPILILMIPTTARAISYDSSLNNSTLININAIVQTGAVVNGASNNNFNIVIIGMIIVIIILIRAAMFPPKK